MGARVDAAEARLLDRMSRARAKHAARRRFRSYVLPISLVAVGLLAADLAQRPGDVLSLSPLLAAAIFARVFGGVAGGRIAAAVGAPLSIYIGVVRPHWYPLFAGVGFIGLCVDAAILPTPKERSYRLVDLRVPAPPERRIWKRWLPAAAPVDQLGHSQP